MKSVHDNKLCGYEVNCDQHTITLHTQHRDCAPIEHTDIVFSHVEAYHVAGDNMQTILFNVDETPIERILNDYTREFEEGIPFCWPGAWNTSPDTCLKHFQDQSCKGWTITSSYGCRGFVIARSMEQN